MLKSYNKTVRCDKGAEFLERRCDDGHDADYTCTSMHPYETRIQLHSQQGRKQKNSQEAIINSGQTLEAGGKNNNNNNKSSFSALRLCKYPEIACLGCLQLTANKPGQEHPISSVTSKHWASGIALLVSLAWQTP